MLTVTVTAAFRNVFNTYQVSQNLVKQLPLTKVQNPYLHISSRQPRLLCQKATTIFRQHCLIIRPAIQSIIPVTEIIYDANYHQQYRCNFFLGFQLSSFDKWDLWEALPVEEVWTIIDFNFTFYNNYCKLQGDLDQNIWVRSRNWGCLVTWFCYQLIAKPGNKTAPVLWPDPYQFQFIPYI